MTEIWKDITGYEGLYQVSNLGRVKSFQRRVPFIMSLNLRKRDGYVTVNLKNGRYRTHKIHQLVCLAFIGECPEGHEPDHKNGVRHDNRLRNLRYVTRGRNLRNIHKCNGATGVVGVYFSNNPQKPTYRVYVTVDYKKRFLGYFNDINLASKARSDFIGSLA